MFWRKRGLGLDPGCHRFAVRNQKLERCCRHPLPVPPPQGGREPDESITVPHPLAREASRQALSSGGTGKRAHLWNSRKLGEKQDEAPILRFPPPVWGRDREGAA